jgi:hypothetical protein
MNNSEFRDLALFREFLIGSDPFTTLRDQIRSFVLPESARRDVVETAMCQLESNDADAGNNWTYCSRA